MNYFLVDINSAQQLDLSGSELLVYSALVYLTKHSAWKGSTYQLAKLSRCGDADTAGRVVKKLIARGLIVRTTLGISLPQNAASLPQNAAVIPQNAAKLKKVTKKNIINNSQSLSVSKETDRTDGQTDFDIFWANFAPTAPFRKYKSACRKFWDSKDMTNDWRARAAEKAKNHLPDRNPYWFLHDYDFLNDGTVGTTKENIPTPTWLNGAEQEECIRAGIQLAVCSNPQTGLFGTVTKQDADLFKLQIHHTINN